MIPILNSVEIINNSVEEYEGARRYLSTGNLNVSHIEEFENYTFEEKPSRANLNVQSDDLILARMQGTNKVLKIDQNISDIMVSTGFLVLRCKKELLPQFLYHILKSRNFQIRKDKYCSGATQKAINNTNFSKLKIPLPPLTTQKRIAQILDNAAALRDKTQQLLTEYDQLVQSIFLDMFGDPVVNKNSFILDSFSHYGDFKNGLNFSKGETGFEVKYLGVGDFKSKYRLDNIDKLSSIQLTKLPSEDYLLKDGDLVFVRSNGNKALVGRCLAIYPDQEKVTFSGFCIRFRLKNEKLNSNFLAQLFQNKRFKQTMLNNGRGAGIQNINQKLLGELKIIVPPINLQNQFAEKIALIEQQKALAKQELQQSDDLFNCLLQKAFKGELV